MSRAQTLVLALLVLHVLLGALCVVIARGEHRSPALRWWGWGLLTYAAGLLVTVVAALGAIPPAVAGTLGNGLVTFAPVLCALAVFTHTLYRPSNFWVVFGVVATVVALGVGNFADYQRLLVNLIGPTPIAVILFGLAAWKIARYGPVEARAANQFLAAILVLAIATWLTRIVAMMGALEGTTDRERIDIVVSLFAIMQMVTGVASTLALLWIDVRLMQSELSRAADTDALTGLANRRAIRRRFSEELARASRHGKGLGFAIFDIARFKQINDRHGHIAGDGVLKEVARTLEATKRTDDVLARIGGEEFVVLFSQLNPEGAAEAAERLREAVARGVVVAAGQTLRATVSGGVAMYPEDGEDWDHLYAVADRRLYEAKRGGRDRVQAQG